MRGIDKRLSRIEAEIGVGEPGQDSGEDQEIRFDDPRSPEQRLRLRKMLYGVLKSMYLPHAEIVVEDLKEHGARLYLWHFGWRFWSGGKMYSLYTPGDLPLTHAILSEVEHWRCEYPLRIPREVSQFFLDDGQRYELHDPCYECGFPHPNTEWMAPAIFQKCALCGGRVMSSGDWFDKRIGEPWPYEKLKGNAPGYRWEDVDSIRVPDCLVYDWDPEAIS